MELTLWKTQDQLAEIKSIYAKGLTDGEFTTFVNMGIATQLNPFLKEIWAVKYGSSPANIFIGRDGYRKAAQRSPEYDFHFVDAVYSGDTFTVENGEVKHNYKLVGRGSLMGAYATAKRKNSTKGSFVFVELSEYDTKQSVWKTKPATMIKKVAEAQVLRMTFQELFAGTYDESEQWENKKKPVIDLTDDGSNEEVNAFTEIKALCETFKSRSEYTAHKPRIEELLLSLTPDVRMQAKNYLLESYKVLPEKDQVKEVQDVFEGELVDPKTGEILDKKPARKVAKKAGRPKKKK